MYENYIFHIRALRNIYTYAVNQQTYTDKICFIVYENAPKA